MTKKKKTVPLRKLLRRAERKADKAFSLYIRAIAKLSYEKCPLCNVKPIECCFHFVTRKRKIVRWDYTNAVGACNTCNFLENFWSDLSRAWYIKTYGVDQYLKLVEKSKEDFKPTVELLDKITADYKSRLAELKI